MTGVLKLPLKRLYFEQIKSGSKTEEFRLATPYWQKRLEGRSYSAIALTLGYPSSGDPERTLTRPWRGFRRTLIQHPLFGAAPVEVYAIDVREPSDPRRRATAYRMETLPVEHWTQCGRCGGSGSVMTTRDMHQSAGIVPCPQQGCHGGTIKSRKVEIHHD